MTAQYPPLATSSPPELVEIALRRTALDDLQAIFEIGSDPLACEMAGVKPRKHEEFFARWKVVIVDPAINSMVIEIITRPNGRREFAGSISVFQVPGETRNSIGYWIARPHWGKGIASRALELFLKGEPRRPLFATASMSNLASHRVMLKNGFRLVHRYHSPESDRLLARETGEFVLD